MFQIDLRSTTEKIHDSIQWCALDSLKEALDEDPEADINAYYQGQTVLCAAVSYTFVEGVEFLLSQPEVDVNLPIQESGRTPLHLTLLNIKTKARKPYGSDIQILKLLLESSAVDPNAKDNEGNTALSIALSCSAFTGGGLQSTRLLLSSPKLKLSTAEIHRLLMKTAAQISPEMIQLLFSVPHIHHAFERFSSDEIKALWAATQQHNEDVQCTIALKILIRSFRQVPDFTFENAVALLPGFKGYIGLREFLEHSQKMSTYPDDFLFCFGFKELFYNFQNVEPVLAEELKDEPLVHCAVSILRKPLHSAVQAFYLDEQRPLFEKLLQSDKIHVNEECDSSEQQTALHLAIKESKLFCVQRLLAKDNIDPTIVNAHGETPLHVAVQTGDVKIISLLLQHPEVAKTLQIKDRSGRTPLCYAIRDDNIPVFKLLIERLKSMGELAGIPDPDTHPAAFVVDSRLKDSPYITAYYAALSVLKTNKNLTCDAVFETLEQQNFPRHQDWYPEHKQFAMKHALRAVEVFPMDLFALDVFLSDGFLDIKKTAESSGVEKEIFEKNTKFFRIMKELPMELQMYASKVAYGKRGHIVSKDSEPAFQRLARKYP